MYLDWLQAVFLSHGHIYGAQNLQVYLLECLILITWLPHFHCHTKEVKNMSITFVFIGPRYTWGPIYGSQVSLTDYTLLKLYTSYRLYTSYTRYTSYRLYTEKVTVSSGAIWWPNLELMQVASSGGRFCN